LKPKLAVRGHGARLIALVAVIATSLAAGALAAGAQEPTQSATPTDTATSLRVTAAKSHVLAGKRASVRGRIASRSAGKTVLLQVRGRRGGYKTVDRARTTEGGRFATAWRAPEPGRYRMRVRIKGARAATASNRRTRAAAQRRTRATVNVYRQHAASWYGPGFWGGRTACGGTLSAGTKGVAHKSLPCGTRVTFRYRGRSVTVPVIDRGPYAGGRSWDLTAATKRALGFPSTGTVWATR
jgi:rare lipoprotein A (peptidoglycan hydrolase)